MMIYTAQTLAHLHPHSQTQILTRSRAHTLTSTDTGYWNMDTRT